MNARIIDCNHPDSIRLIIEFNKLFIWWSDQWPDRVSETQPQKSAYFSRANKNWKINWKKKKEKRKIDCRESLSVCPYAQWMLAKHMQIQTKAPKLVCDQFNCVCFLYRYRPCDLPTTNYIFNEVLSARYRDFVYVREWVCLSFLHSVQFLSIVRIEQQQVKKNSHKK